MLARMQGKGNTYSVLVELQIGVATMEISVKNSQKAKNRSPV